MRFLDNEIYRGDVGTAVRNVPGFDLLKNKKILVLGAAGLIGSFLTDCFLYANEYFDAGITIYAMGRSRERLEKRFGHGCCGGLQFMEADITDMSADICVDYIINAAGYGHPKAFRKMPAEVLLSNVIGTRNALEMARRNNKECRFLCISTGEVQEYKEHLTVRACYPVGKMAAETLCLSYRQEYGTDAVIARPCHTFGANAAAHDNRAAAQFLLAAAQGNDIEMYSTGEQQRSFSYVADCASGLLTVLLNGKAGLVYGISSGESCTIKEFADKCANIGKCKIKLHTPAYNEKLEASPINKQIVSNDDLRKLGWRPAFTIDEGIVRAIEIIRKINGG